MRRTFTPTLLPMLLVSACATTPAVSYGVKIDPATRPSCESNCEQMGLKLSAVVLVRNSVGCVCAVPDAKASAAAGGGAVGVASSVLIVEEENEMSQAAAGSPGARVGL